MISRARLLLIVVYLLLIAGIVAGMFALRRQTLSTQSSPEAIAQWQQWREEAARQSETGPVRRRIPKTEAPPGLILMRDSFPALLAASVFFSSVLYFLLAWALRGALAQKGPRPQVTNRPPN